MFDLSSLPKLDLLKNANTELSDLVTTESTGLSNTIVLKHSINYSVDKFMIGYSEIVRDNNYLIIDFKPYSRTIVDSMELVNSSSDSDMRIVQDSLLKESYLSEFFNYDILFGFLENESIISPVSIDSKPVALIRGYAGRIDVMAHLQSLDFIKNNYRNVVSTLFVKNVESSLVWSGVLSKAGINSKNRFHKFLRFIPSYMDETFDDYYKKITAYAKKHNLVE